MDLLFQLGFGWNITKKPNNGTVDKVDMTLNIDGKLLKEKD
jgi:hypothetical protein